MKSRIISLISLFFFSFPLSLAGCNSQKTTAEITVINGKGSGTYNIGETITITAMVPYDKMFDCWSVNEKKVSEDNPYSFTVKKSETYKAFFKERTGPFNPDEVQAKMLVVSDVHITANDANSKNHLKNTLNYALDNHLDAIIFDGDTISVANEADYSALDNVFTEIYKTPKSEGFPELIFNMGNHEFYPTDNCAFEETNYEREVGIFKQFAEKWGNVIEDNVFTREIKGIECIFAFPSADRRYIYTRDSGYVHYGDTVYLAAAGAFSQNDINKAQQKIDNILSTGYDKPIIFCTHHPLGQTYGSTTYGMDIDAEYAFKAMLKNYPSIVHFAGHTHFSNLHERSIAQNDFTSIQIGMHTYGKYVSGVDYDEEDHILIYENITNKRYNDYDVAAQNYHGQTNFGMLLSFTNVSLVAERINLSFKQIYNHGNWTIPYGITKANKNSKFIYKDRDRTGEQLSFADDSEINVTINNGKITSLIFNDVDEYWACEGYEISVDNEQNQSLFRLLWSSHFWMGLEEKQTYTIPISNIGDVSIGSGYYIKIRAINFFGHYSEPIIHQLAS